MRTNEFVIRGQTGSDKEEVLSFSGRKPGYAYNLVEFSLYPSTNIGDQSYELCGTITAGKIAEDPANPNYKNQGLIATALVTDSSSVDVSGSEQSVIDDTFLITQDLIIKVKDTKAGSPQPSNWQCKFKPVKLQKAEEAVANYKQFMIFDE